MSQGYLNNDGGLRVWFRDEIRNALLSAYTTLKTTTDSSGQSRESDAFRRGFIAALLAIGLNFGIVLPVGDEWNRVIEDTANEKT